MSELEALGMKTKPRIIYFDIRGRAEPIRLLLEESGVAYSNTNFSPSANRA